MDRSGAEGAATPSRKCAATVREPAEGGVVQVSHGSGTLDPSGRHTGRAVRKCRHLVGPWQRPIAPCSIVHIARMFRSRLRNAMRPGRWGIMSSP
ncbi:hypothetical protein GCM10010361_69230 [Streptomyces olivaceiscleroticus]|uniref:Uncharacterized protein n=1 Tax=Streptomyces olivaceiscleroticus TaxID=68245 RepID=A0ABP3L661_9ACTN